MAFEKKYKFLVTVPQEKVAAAEETFVRYGGQAYLKRRTTATSPEFVMNVVRMNIPWRRLRGRVNVHLEEPENEVTLVYIVNDSQMTGLKEELFQRKIAGYSRESAVSYSAHNLMAKLHEIPDDLRTDWHLFKWHLRQALGLD